jgi:hypothetical protein
MVALAGEAHGALQLGSDVLGHDERLLRLVFVRVHGTPSIG